MSLYSEVQLKPGENIRKLFPLLRESELSLTYLDSAATAQKPDSVIEAELNFYKANNANIHRGVYELSERATTQYDEARVSVQKFLNAKHSSEIIFTSGATASLNLVAHSYARTFLEKGDEIIVSILEHHANFIPWQEVAKATGAVIKFVGLDSNQTFDLSQYKNLLSPNTKLVAITELSNALGIRTPLKEIISLAHDVGALVVVDGAQGVTHGVVDVQDLDADFYAFSAHKLYGPTGVGVLYGKRSLLDKMPPFLFGGDMIRTVSVEGSEYAESPAKFEAGTPNIAGVAGLKAAVEFMNSLDRTLVEEHELKLISELLEVLKNVPGLTTLAPNVKHYGAVSFYFDRIHPHDVAQFLDRDGIAVRAGHHCTQPLHAALGVTASVRASVGVYSTSKDIERLGDSLLKVSKFFSRK